MVGQDGDLDRDELLARIARSYARQRRLSPRETAVFLKFVLHNKANKEIASELGIGYPTVRIYWSRIFKKLECDHEQGAMLGLLRYSLCTCPACHREDDTN